MLFSRVGDRANAAGVVALRRFGLLFLGLWHESLDAGSTRLQSLESFRQILGLVSVFNGNLDVSLVVEAPYLPGYIVAE
ncbi:hypothetical protein BDN67DRAFT_66304 [Paxillus ammoniavirescens]|nr:hypothetical protein BDN67DRAFT_66304 [Paxillus ammoniavirescens]